MQQGQKSSGNQLIRPARRPLSRKGQDLLRDVKPSLQTSNKLQTKGQPNRPTLLQAQALAAKRPDSRHQVQVILREAEQEGNKRLQDRQHQQDQLKDQAAALVHRRLRAAITQPKHFLPVQDRRAEQPYETIKQ